ncbi:MAG: RHS repeat-associated core domain-containing protein, partial [Cyclobacteriaceae bacterium]|nr:RHS repeat-associated core domain-containing protein [Cyclobacteriaceae bacterium]
MEITERSKVKQGEDGYRYALPAEMKCRLGFQGQEKDDGGEWGSEAIYDYGFRIYNPGIGRWMSVDPLAQKYAGLSPFNYVKNNPLIYIDPDGLDVYTINYDGSIVRQLTDDNYNTYTYIDKAGTSHDVGTYYKNEKGLIQLPTINDTEGSGAKITPKPTKDNELFISGNALAGLIGASAYSGEEMYVNGVSYANGGSPPPSITHIDGDVFDLRFTGKNGSRGGLNYKKHPSDFYKIDMDASKRMNAGLRHFGWSTILASTYMKIEKQFMLVQGNYDPKYSEYYFQLTDVKVPVNITGTTHWRDHYDHEHVMTFRPKIKERPALKPLTKVKPIGIQL